MSLSSLGAPSGTVIAPRFGRVKVDTESFKKFMPQSDGAQKNTVENRTKEFEVAQKEMAPLVFQLEKQGYDLNIRAIKMSDAPSGFHFAFDLVNQAKEAVLHNEYRGLYPGSSAVNILSEALGEGFLYDSLKKGRDLADVKTKLETATTLISGFDAIFKTQIGNIGKFLEKK